MKEIDFIQKLGDTPRMRIICFLIEGRELDYDILTLIKGVEHTRKTVEKELDVLFQSKLIIQTRKIGKTYLWKLNKDNFYSMFLTKIYDYQLKENLKTAIYDYQLKENLKTAEGDL